MDGPEKWIGTNIKFELSERDNQTILLFGHENWVEAVEFTSHCNMKCAIFLLSPREYVETSLRKPSPHDIIINNWN